MKKIACVILLVLLLCGCSMKNREMERGLTLRTALLGSSLCSFDVDIIADYGDKLHVFSMNCQADSTGTVRFTVTAPESISGITGTVDGEKGALTFGDTALYIPLLADNQVTPVCAPWLLLKTLRAGFITSAGSEEKMTRLSIDDRYEDDALHLDVWLEESGTPVKAEVLYRERRILSMDVKNFTLQ